ncbi:ATPase [Salinarimonas soli]|uniref:ATPase n=1 Tax=Salinarimonas soli TaxID=1638099 RepID=A0A5B2VDJ1_9HYPH|nr:ATPase [Salinarimonas soli]
MSRDAERLLAGLARDGAHGLADPLDAARIVLRVGTGGVSLGGGSFARAAADALVGHDLAAWSGRRLTVSEAGAARVRRRAAGAEGFAGQHREMAAVTLATPEGPVRVAVNTAESPLDWLRRRRDRDGSPLIDAAAYEAGERLRRDLTQAGLMPGVTQRWDGLSTGRGGAAGPAAATDSMVAARQRLRAALQAVGPDFADLLVDLCGFLKGLETLERDRGWPARAGKVVVRLALGRLADHYGLAREAAGPAGSRGIRAWAELDAVA